MAHESIYSFAELQNRLYIQGTLVAMTALRIGSGRSSDILGNDLPMLRDTLGAPFVPGASLKGAFRARVEALIRAIQPKQALDLQELEAWQRDIISPIIQDKQFQDDRKQSNAIWTHSTLIDLTFGAPWIAGRIFFKDAFVDRSLWFDQFEIRNGVALNRDTETAENGMLYDYEVVPAGMRFNFELTMENAAPWQLGLVILALRPWQRGDVQIGGFRSRGLGHVQLDNLRASYTTIETADDVLSLLGYGDSSITYDLSVEKTDAQIQQWFDAFKEALTDPQKVIDQGVSANA